MLPSVNTEVKNLITAEDDINMEDIINITFTQSKDILEKPDFSLIKSNKAITGYGPCEECDIPILTEKPPRLIILNVCDDIIHQTCAKELIKKERYIAMWYR
ncbi:hypothetical protein RhiirA4_471032 [Rhizophagus irregularis]|uniref:Uncharacterized protein n=1 Tax=Rhizophagus irregularis TaxID=588596 RepID=A0A2I1H2J4_9GLOM|nr:hypothetical protein RhiirA4_471032 [Rhizophagus irregularis]